MYKIVHNGEVKAICDAPRYVKVKPRSGALIETTADDAEFVAVHGTPYPISEVAISEVDGGMFGFDEYVHMNDYKSTIASLEDAMCEIDSIEE